MTARKLIKLGFRACDVKAKPFHNGNMKDCKLPPVCHIYNNISII